jgi:hypothetical protein
MWRRRIIKSMTVLAALSALGVVPAMVSSCSSSSVRDINYGKEAGTGFDAPIGIGGASGLGGAGGGEDTDAGGQGGVGGVGGSDDAEAGTAGAGGTALNFDWNRQEIGDNQHQNLNNLPIAGRA